MLSVLYLALSSTSRLDLPTPSALGRDQSKLQSQLVMPGVCKIQDVLDQRCFEPLRVEGWRWEPALKAGLTLFTLVQDAAA
mmetsp:Transcript_126315/g.232637  ORF Transcript_126315/g.232637 Transcript_126315/m.232637 type:complete len:81 (-) Transcript_126315:35-277(-)